MSLNILHPYDISYDGSHLQKRINVEIKGETWNGVPHGWCNISYKNADGESKSNFEGFVHFMNGEIHGGPAIITEPNGLIRLFTYMKHGRSEGLMKLYLPEKHKGKFPTSKV
jgi:hypothetical protein